MAAIILQQANKKNYLADVQAACDTFAKTIPNAIALDVYNEIREAKYDEERTLKSFLSLTDPAKGIVIMMASFYAMTGPAGMNNSKNLAVRALYKVMISGQDLHPKSLCILFAFTILQTIEDTHLPVKFGEMKIKLGDQMRVPNLSTAFIGGNFEADYLEFTIEHSKLINRKNKDKTVEIITAEQTGYFNLGRAFKYTYNGVRLAQVKRPELLALKPTDIVPPLPPANPGNNNNSI
jgi:hypothetical protein